MAKKEFEVIVETDEKIYLTSTIIIENILLKVIINNITIYDINLNKIEPNIRYWFLPNDKSYLNNTFFVEILDRNNNIIFKEKIESYFNNMDFDHLIEKYNIKNIKGVSYKDIGQEGHGRIGNQFFEIAATISLARENNVCALFPEWKYSKYFDNDISDDNIENFEIKSTYHYGDSKYKKIPYTPNMDLHGFFQSEKYFKQYEKEIRNLFTLKSEYENNLRNKWAHLLNTKTVSIHVRRTDYLDNPTFHIIPTMSYFKKSLKYIEYLDSFNKIENVLIFSDDIDWCRNNFTDNDYKYNFIENQSDIEDLFLMSYCDHNIISNSSFSWWGSWLNKNENKIICAPYQWFGDGWDMDYKDIFTENMKIIKY